MIQAQVGHGFTLVKLFVVIAISLSILLSGIAVAAEDDRPHAVIVVGTREMLTIVGVAEFFCFNPFHGLDRGVEYSSGSLHR